MAKKIDYNKHIWEGWSVLDFINDLQFLFNYKKSEFKTKKELKEWCMDNQPYYKKYIPEVVNHFNQELNLK